MMYDYKEIAKNLGINFNEYFYLSDSEHVKYFLKEDGRLYARDLLENRCDVFNIYWLLKYMNESKEQLKIYHSIEDFPCKCERKDMYWSKGVTVYGCNSEGWSKYYARINFKDKQIDFVNSVYGVDVVDAIKIKYCPFCGKKL